MAATTASTPSSKRARGSSSRVVMAQPWPAWVQTMKAAMPGG